MKTYQNLRDLREKFAHVRLGSVSARSGISAVRLAQIEDGDPADICELEALSRVYGIDAEHLFNLPISLPAGDVAGVLASFEEFQELQDGSRLAALSIARVARDLAALAPTSWAGLPRLIPCSKSLPHERGANYAEQLRKLWGLGQGPILSMRDLLREKAPGVRILYAHLGEKGPSALSFLDSVHGPLIVLNLDGKNENPCVRRFSLAHELCHVLVDRAQGEMIASISGYRLEPQLDRERQANAFATRFICPEQAVRDAADKYRPQDIPTLVIQDYGLHYRAAQLYLKNLGVEELPFEPPNALAGLPLAPAWQRAEEPWGLEPFPLGRVPPERRTSVAFSAAAAFARGEIPRDMFAEYLGVTPGEELERVLDYFDIEGESEDCVRSPRELARSR